MRLNDRLIGFTALACAGVGLALLLVGLQTETYATARIAQLTDDWNGKKVSVSGIVDWAKPAKSAWMFGLDDGAKITGIAFKPGADELRLLRGGRRVRVQGTLQKYQDQLELTLDRVEALD